MSQTFHPGDEKWLLIKKIQEQMIEIGLSNIDAEGIRPGDTYAEEWAKILAQLDL